MARARGEALAAAADAYRAYAREHPGTYAALQRAPDPGDAEATAAAAEAVGLHRLRLARGEHGFGLPQDVDESFARLTATLDRGLG